MQNAQDDYVQEPQAEQQIEEPYQDAEMAEEQPVESQEEDVVEAHEDDEEGAPSESTDTPDYMRKHFRRLEKKLKHENRELHEKLAVTNHQLNQYGELFQSTYANAYPSQQVQDVEPQDEVEAKVLDIIKRRDSEAQKQRIAAEQNLQRKTVLDALNRNLEQGSDTYDDFEEVVHDPKLPLSEDIAIATTYLPNGADVLYSLAKNRDELNRINSIRNQQEKMLALSTYAFNLVRGGDKVINSKAPKPISSPQLKDKPSTKPDASRMNYEQLKAFRKSQAQQRQPQRKR